MATKLLVCPECASAIAPGRFACTSCGALLASVATAPRTLGWTDAPSPPALTPSAPERVSEPPIDADSTDPATAEAVEPMKTIGPAWAHGPLERAPGETDLDLLDEDDGSHERHVDTDRRLEASEQVRPEQSHEEGPDRDRRQPRPGPVGQPIDLGGSDANAGDHG